jgi:GH15 family glucan-1,4-alpha-glucosidase
MALPIEDYGIIGDLHTVALVGRDGSMDWLCLPRFDSAACFAKLLGDDDNGSWKIAPKGALFATHRHYRGDSLVLESEFVTDEGTVRIIDCMPIRERNPEVIRLVEGVRGRVTMEMSLTIRFGYGQIVPWVRRVDGTLNAIAGPDALALWTPVETRGRDLSTIAEFTISEGQRIPFYLAWYAANEEPPRPADARYVIEDTELWWSDWASHCNYEGEYREAVVRSLITLKALTYQPTGGIVAAPTTSLPETLGGGRNWDYRFCWLRDATLTLESLMRGGFYEEAMQWRGWLLRTVAGDPSQLQIMYGSGGERRLDEFEIGWLAGYEGSSPVRVGNAAAGQFQLDVYGEVMSALYESAQQDSMGDSPAWQLQLALMDYLETGWRDPDDGIWEVRGPRRHFTHSKMMAWVAIDRAIKTIEQYGAEGPLDRWKATRREIFDQVCNEGYNTKKGCFTQYYGSDDLDASLLMMPLYGFLPAQDPRVKSTIEAIERELMEGDFVLRYRTADTGEVDGLTGREGAFLACSFWLADCYSMLGRDHDARKLFERLMSLRNDLGLLSEEYDPVAGRLVGNFPQAFSHVSLVNTAAKLTGQEKPTVDHVVLGLAREAMARGKASIAGGSLRGDAARTMLQRLQRAARAGRGDGSPVTDVPVTATDEKVLGPEGHDLDGTATRWRGAVGRKRPTRPPAVKTPGGAQVDDPQLSALPTRSKKKAAAYRAATLSEDGSGGRTGSKRTSKSAKKGGSKATAKRSKKTGTDAASKRTGKSASNGGSSRARRRSTR